MFHFPFFVLLIFFLFSIYNKAIYKFRFNIETIPRKNEDKTQIYQFHVSNKNSAQHEKKSSKRKEFKLIASIDMCKGKERQKKENGYIFKALHILSCKRQIFYFFRIQSDTIACFTKKKTATHNFKSLNINLPDCTNNAKYAYIKLG